jgi:dolichol-phosphate mannosyltransferase
MLAKDFPVVALSVVAKEAISVVVPLFNEQENLASLHARLTRSLSELGVSYELIFVNDGSRDETPEMLNRLAQKDANVVAVHLSRNFGHQAAVSAGLDRVQGDAVIVMDGDLQDPPEVLGQFIQRWREGHDVVYAIRTKRKENWIKRVGYFVFYRLFRMMSDMDIPLDSGDFCLMDQKIVQTLQRLPEKQRFVRGLRTFVGFKQTGLAYERAAREAGRPKYTFAALIRLAGDGIFNFTSVPLKMITTLGTLLALIVVVGLAWVVGDYIHTNTAPAGWLWATLAVGLVGSLNLLSLGIIGEYLHRVFAEVKNRPTYVVANVVRKEAIATMEPNDARKTA